MAIDANDAVKNTTRPHDFIREGEESEYSKIYSSLMLDLSPEGTLEQTFATEIMGCTWRLRRCRLVEFNLAENAVLDPMIDEKTGKLQKSVDRARAHTHNVLRRSIAELRTLQTERTIRLHLDVQENIPGLTNTRQLLQALKLDHSQEKSGAGGAACPGRDREAERSSAASAVPPAPGSFCKPDEPSGVGAGACPGRDREGERSSAASAVPPAPASFCKPDEPAPPAQQPLVKGSFCKTTSAAPPQPKMTPRNKPCPCGSGAKFKRCHGKDAPPVLDKAA